MRRLGNDPRPQRPAGVRERAEIADLFRKWSEEQKRRMEEQQRGAKPRAECSSLPLPRRLRLHCGRMAGRPSPALASPRDSVTTCSMPGRRGWDRQGARRSSGDLRRGKISPSTFATRNETVSSIDAIRQRHRPSRRVYDEMILSATPSRSATATSAADGSRTVRNLARGELAYKATITCARTILLVAQLREPAESARSSYLLALRSPLGRGSVCILSRHAALADA